MRYIYLVEYRQLSKATNCFELYRTEAFSSKLKAKANVENVMECNKAFNINEDTSSYLEENVGRVDYTSLGWGRDDTRVEMRLRLVINKVELR